LRIGIQQIVREGQDGTGQYQLRWNAKRRAKFGRDTPWQAYTFLKASRFSGENRVFGSKSNIHQSFEGQQGTDALWSITVKDKPRTSLKTPRGRDLNSGECYLEYTFHVASSIGTVENNFNNLRVGDILTGTASTGIATAIVGPNSCPDASGN
jgi:hypothetical protein